MTAPRLEIRGVCKAWAGRTVLDGASLSLAPGEHTLVRGASGAGKSTLLGILARLVRPDAGEVRLDGTPIVGLGSATRYRREQLGLVFQEPHLVDGLTVIQNIEMASINAQRPQHRPRALLERLGLVDRAGVRAGVLSRGERQRLAVARAFVGRPRLVLADEPTASLDPAARDTVLAQLMDLADAAGATLLLVSHDLAVSPDSGFKRQIALTDGRLDTV